MIEKLETEQSRRMFFVIVVLGLLAIFLIQHFLLPCIFGDQIHVNRHLLYSIFDKLFISVLVTVGLAAFIFWLNPKNDKNAQIKILQPTEIGEQFVKARLNTERWWFNGACGRYTRSVTLPFLAESCRQNNKIIEVVIQMLNPDNSDICNAYANYRNGLRSATNESKRTAKTVKLSLLATIISAYVWKTEQPHLRIKICLKDYFSLFRVDLSSDKAIITREDPMEPAILYENGTFFYSAYYQDLVQTLNQSKLHLHIMILRNIFLFHPAEISALVTLREAYLDMLPKAIHMGVLQLTSNLCSGVYKQRMHNANTKLFTDFGLDKPLAQKLSAVITQQWKQWNN